MTHAGEKGFVLIETLVALTLLALILAMLFRAMADISRTYAYIDQHETALLIARSAIDEGDAKSRMEIAQLLQVSRNTLDLPYGPTLLPSRPFQIRIEIHDRSGRQLLQLETIQVLSAKGAK